jgi:hypothetical protein
MSFVNAQSRCETTSQVALSGHPSHEATLQITVPLHAVLLLVALAVVIILIAKLHFDSGSQPPIAPPGAFHVRPGSVHIGTPSDRHTSVLGRTRF